MIKQSSLLRRFIVLRVLDMDHYRIHFHVVPSVNDYEWPSPGGLPAFLADPKDGVNNHFFNSCLKSRSDPKLRRNNKRHEGRS